VPETRKTILSQMLILSVLAIIPAAASGLWHPRRPSWTPIVASEGEVLLRTTRSWGGDVLWVDTRPPQDYLLDRIPGALPLSVEQWNLLSPDILAAAGGKHVVVYCADNACTSARAVADRLKRDGKLDKVYVLKGGFQAWNAAMQ